jgi:cyanophycin synthetase
MYKGVPGRFFQTLSDFYWKKKWKLIRSLRRRGFDLSARIGTTVPTVGITGSVGKTTTCRMVAHILARTGRTVALATTQGTYIGAETIQTGDSAGSAYLARLLRDRRVEAGVFEFARGGLIRDGMALTACDVGVVLNIHDNHIGQDGVGSREDLARIKRVVVRKARRMAVLNADDPLCLAMREDVRASRTCLVSMRPDNPAVLEHRAAHGPAVVLDDSGTTPLIQVWEGRTLVAALDGSAIPATYGGSYQPSVNNALFATAAAYGLGIECTEIWDALREFSSSHETNPGRMNFFAGLPYALLLTRASSAQVMRELALFVRGLPVEGARHLMFSMVGNRPDDYLREAARAAAGRFDSYICSDWEELRGRGPGEVAGLLAQGLLREGVPESLVTVAPTHDEALRLAFSRARPGDLLVIISLSQQKVWDMAERLRAAGVKTSF